MSKRIGFVDFVSDNFHANTYLELIRGKFADLGFEVSGCWAMNAESGQAWAVKNQVPWAQSAEVLDGMVDYYAILAPSTPEHHLPLCEAVFPFGKPTYVDKTFAPDLETAKAIFSLADKHRVAVQTASALRYTNVQDAITETPSHMVTWGGGSSFGEYAIHPVELMVSCMGPKATRLMRRGRGDQSQLIIDFTEGRTGVVNVYANAQTPFAASLTTAGETRFIPVDSSAIFANMAAAILDLFDAATPSIDREESLAIRAILDAAADPAALEGFVAI